MRPWQMSVLTRFAAILVFIAFGGDSSTAQSTGQLRLFSSVPDAPPPAEWVPFLSGTNRVPFNPVSGYRTMSMQPGRYDVRIRPTRQSSFIDFGTVDIVAGAVTEFDLNSGLRIDPVRPNGIRRWLIAERGAQTLLASLEAADRYVHLPQGSYDLYFEEDEVARPKPLARVSVKAGEIAHPTIGVVDLSGDAGEQPIRYWNLIDVATGETVAQRKNSWGAIAASPGRYRVETSLKTGETMKSSDILVDARAVVKLTPAALNIGFVSFETRFPKDLRVVFGGEAFEHRLVIGDRPYNALGERGGTPLLPAWLPAGHVALETRHGDFRLFSEGEVVAGQRLDFSHGVSEALAAGASAFRISETGENGCIERLSVSDRYGGMALMTEAPPQLDALYLAPVGADIRVISDGRETRYGPLSAGAREDISVECGARILAGVEAVDVIIEAPIEGAVLAASTREVTVVGHASTTTEAGATQVFVLLDLSGSTLDPSGADIDGDDVEESVLDAEITAVLKLIEELDEVEAASPGTAFVVSVIAFGSSAETVLTPTPLSSEDTLPRLRTALQSLEPSPRRGGDTYYGRALDAALRIAETEGRPGPRIALLITDGKPSELSGAIDAASRAGRAGFTLHAIGLGADFAEDEKPRAAFPPFSDRGVDTLATMAAFGAPGGRVWSLERPADIVSIIDSLPVKDRAKSELVGLEVVNVTTGHAAIEVDLRSDGAFEATIPIELAQTPERWTNSIRVTARSVLGGPTAETEIELRVAGLNASVRKLVEKRADDLEEEVAALTAALTISEATTAEVRQDQDRLEREGRDLRERLARAKEDARRATAEAQKAEIQRASATRDRDDRSSRLRDADKTIADLKESLTTSSAAAEQCIAAKSQCQSQLIEAIVVPGLEEIIVPLKDTFLFGVDEATLTPKAKSLLSTLKPFFIENLSSDIVVRGYTDSQGAADYNRALSQRRANEVASWLVSNLNVDRGQIKAIGRGEADPVASNDTLEGRQANRRVEISFVRDSIEKE